MERMLVDGVPVAWEEGPEPGMVSLQFRVGLADERPARRGISHIVEHLAMYGLGNVHDDVNAFVDPLFTGFYRRGSADELAAFAAAVTHALADLRFSRLDTELRVLRTEAAGASPSLAGRMLMHRFGGIGFGALNVPELGLRWLGPEEIEAWRRARFTTGQAALWLHGPRAPHDMRWTLPPGDRLALPPVDPLPGLRLPAWIPEGSGGIAVAMMAARSWATTIGLGVAMRRLHARLRVDEGLVYDVDADYQPLGAEQAHVLLSAGCLDEHAERVARLTLVTLEDLASAGPTQEELETAVRRARPDPGGVEAVRGRLDRAITDVLLGASPPSDGDLDRLDAPAVAAALRDALGGALVLVPEGCGAPREDLAILDRDVPPVEGRRFKARGLRQADELVVGDAGVTWRDAEAEVTIPADEISLVIRETDGALTVYGRDTAMIQVDPQRLHDGEQFVDALEVLSPDPFVPSADERAGRVRDLAAEQLKRRWTVRAELDLLPGVLAEDEQPRLMAEADRGARTGLLVLTDRQLIFLFEGLRKEELLQLRLEEISDAKGHTGPYGGSLRFKVEGSTLRFTGIVPRSRAGELATALRAGAR